MTARSRKSKPPARRPMPEPAARLVALLFEAAEAAQALRDDVARHLEHHADYCHADELLGDLDEMDLVGLLTRTASSIRTEFLPLDRSNPR